MSDWCAARVHGFRGAYVTHVTHVTTFMEYLGRQKPRSSSHAVEWMTARENIGEILDRQEAEYLGISSKYYIPVRGEPIVVASTV